MRNPLIVGLVWVASLVLVFLIGANFGPSATEDRSAVARRGVASVSAAAVPTDVEQTRAEKTRTVPPPPPTTAAPAGSLMASPTKLNPV